MARLEGTPGLHVIFCCKVTNILSMTEACADSRCFLYKLSKSSSNSINDWMQLFNLALRLCSLVGGAKSVLAGDEFAAKSD